MLASGLDEEACKQLGNKYPTPENCKLIKPPSINQEVRMALSESVLRRDARLASLQQQVAASLSAIGLALTHMLKETGGGNKTHIELLSDAGRLLANVHYSESVSRRELIALNLNKDLKEVLTSTPIAESLFGNDLDSRVKSAKDLEKAALQLKSSKKPVTTRTNSTSTFRGQGNYQSPLPFKIGARRSGHPNRVPVRSQPSRNKRTRQLHWREENDKRRPQRPRRQ